MIDREGPFCWVMRSGHGDYVTFQEPPIEYRPFWTAVYTSPPAQAVPEGLRNAVLSKLHDAVGYCGHCGKRECGGRQGNSRLPDSILTETLIAAFDAALAAAPKPEVKDEHNT